MIIKTISTWLDFLFPKKCLICEKDNEDYLCFNCFKKLKNKKPICLECGSETKLGEFCNNCQKNYDLRGILVAGDFNDKNLASLIKSYKYNFIKDLAHPLSLFLINFLKEQLIRNPILPKLVNYNQIINLRDFSLLSVPLSKKRLRWRGFNQSELLAQNIAKEFDLELLSDLKKIKHRRPQANLNKEERLINLKNCFEWRGKSLSNKKIIIIDDVCTTGATLNEIAVELKKHQAQEIWGLVLAHG
ncbi:MAG TPA: double zinc ribbon domain-containing protein [bacterium]|nr:double zinc ribbon domain-containing protein [bacterium]